MRKNELFYLSSDKKTNIHMVMWEPEDKVLGVIQIVHGVTEHIMRYEDFANFFTSRGIAVVGIDLLGHGLSTNNGEKQMYFGESGSWNYVVKDIEECFLHIKEIYTDVPVVLLGFSLGSFVVRTLMINNYQIGDGFVLIGTGYTSSLAISLALNVVKSESRKYGDNVATDKIRDLTFGTYNKKFKPNRTDYDWLCSNQEAIDSYVGDPLVGRNMTIGLFRELLYGMKYTCFKDNVFKMNKEKPILLLSGNKDSVGNDGKGVEKVYKLFKSVGILDVSFKLYDNLRHDILHEKNYLEIYEYILNWMNSKSLTMENDSLVQEEKVVLSKKLVHSDDVSSVLLKK